MFIYVFIMFVCIYVYIVYVFMCVLCMCTSLLFFNTKKTTISTDDMIVNLFVKVRIDFHFFTLLILSNSWIASC